MTGIAIQFGGIYTFKDPAAHRRENNGLRTRILQEKTTQKEYFINEKEEVAFPVLGLNKADNKYYALTDEDGLKLFISLFSAKKQTAIVTQLEKCLNGDGFFPFLLINNYIELIGRQIVELLDNAVTDYVKTVKLSDIKEI